MGRGSDENRRVDSEARDVAALPATVVVVVGVAPAVLFTVLNFFVQKIEQGSVVIHGPSIPLQMLVSRVHLRRGD